MRPINDTQQKIYEFLCERSQCGVPPSVREIGSAVGLRSTSSVQANLDALEEAGYIIRRQLRDKDGRMSHSEYLVFEVPELAKPILESPSSENPTAVNPSTGEPLTGNPTQSNTNQVITQKENTLYINDPSINHSCRWHGNDETDVMEVRERYKEIIEEWSKDAGVRVHLTIDNPSPDWDGHVGFVPNYVKELGFDTNKTAVLCGPPIMIKFTLAGLQELGFDKTQVYTTLELRMKCGIGKCGRCNVGSKYVCKDGPVFRCDELDELPDEY